MLIESLKALRIFLRVKVKTKEIIIYLKTYI